MSPGCPVLPDSLISCRKCLFFAEVFTEINEDVVMRLGDIFLIRTRDPVHTEGVKGHQEGPDH